MRLRLILLALVAVAVATAGLPAAPTTAQSSGPQRVIPVFPGVERQEWTLRTPGGAPVAAQVLKVAADESLQIRPVMAQDEVPGLETVPSMARRSLPNGAVAGINGGFWLFQPVGDPNSYLSMDGRLVSEAETQAETGRGTYGITREGAALIDRIETKIELFVPDGEITIDAVNRVNRGGAGATDSPYRDGPNTKYVYTTAYGQSVTLQGPELGDRYRGPATVVPIQGADLPASGASGGDGFVGPSRTVDGGAVPIPPDGMLLVGYGDGGRELASMAEGTRVYANVQVRTLERDRDIPWSQVDRGLAAGPLIVREGRMTDPSSWGGEGFSPGHNNNPSPRTAVGVNAEGESLLVTVDGRQKGYSEGMTMAQLADFMISLDAVEAVAMDGGGSTTMTVDGLVRNRVSEGSPRPVATGLFVFHDYEFTGTGRLSGSGRVETAAAAALDAYPDGSREVVVASAGGFPDALAGGPLATALSAPLLLTGGDQLSAASETAMRQLGARRVTLLGGTGVISEDLEESLRRSGYEVRRVSGASRFETAAGIAAAVGRDRERIVLASGEGFADALSVASPAGLLGAPIVLTGRATLPQATRDAIVRSGADEVVIVGGTSAVSAGVERAVRGLSSAPGVTRLAGSTRFGTARVINAWAAGQIPALDQTGMVVADGGRFPDALAGGPLAASRGQLLMIVPGPSVDAQDDAAAYLDERAAGPLERITLLGGYGVLSSHQQWQLDQYANR